MINVKSQIEAKSHPLFRKHIFGKTTVGHQSDSLDWCVRSWNTLNDLSNKVYVPRKTEDLNLSIFNMITGTNESKTLKKHISCECKCKFDGRKYN